MTGIARTRRKFKVLRKEVTNSGTENQRIVRLVDVWSRSVHLRGIQFHSVTEVREGNGRK